MHQGTEMTKKKVPLHRSEELESVDSELDEAMSRLTDSNDRITELLDRIDTAGESGEDEAADSTTGTPPRADEAPDETASA